MIVIYKCCLCRVFRSIYLFFNYASTVLTTWLCLLRWLIVYYDTFLRMRSWNRQRTMPKNVSRTVSVQNIVTMNLALFSRNSKYTTDSNQNCIIILVLRSKQIWACLISNNGSKKVSLLWSFKTKRFFIIWIRPSLCCCTVCGEHIRN